MTPGASPAACASAVSSRKRCINDGRASREGRGRDRSRTMAPWRRRRSSHRSSDRTRYASATVLWCTPRSTARRSHRGQRVAHEKRAVHQQCPNRVGDLPIRGHRGGEVDANDDRWFHCLMSTDNRQCRLDLSKSDVGTTGLDGYRSTARTLIRRARGAGAADRRLFRKRLLDDPISQVRRRRRWDHLDNVKLHWLAADTLEQPHPAAEQDRDDVELNLVDESGAQELLRDVWRRPSR